MSKMRYTPASYRSSKISQDEIIAIIHPMRNTGLRKFIGLSSYGGLASLLFVFYMDINESDGGYLARRFCMGALGFPALRMLMQLGYYCSTGSHAQNLYVSGLAGFLTGMWLGYADYTLPPARTILPALAIAVGAMAAESVF